VAQRSKILKTAAPSKIFQSMSAARRFPPPWADPVDLYRSQKADFPPPSGY
jgi:hypothetical protein